MESHRPVDQKSMNRSRSVSRCARRVTAGVGGKGEPSIDTAKQVAVMQDKHEIASGMMHGFDWWKWHTGMLVEKMSLLPDAQEHILEQENGKERFVQVVTELFAGICSMRRNRRSNRDSR
jgi:hypothetical protein